MLAPTQALEIDTERQLVALGVALLGRARAGWSARERALSRRVESVSPELVRRARGLILAGGDPLGDAFGRLRSAELRRRSGTVYTPPLLVQAMTAEAGGRSVARVVDAGAGSGRFLRAAGGSFPDAELVGVELEPVATLMLRANLGVVGMAPRLRVVTSDYRTAALGTCAGRTLFLGNPPYVRHHGIEPRWKAWLSTTAGRFGLRASQLAGQHVHFFVATALHGRSGDFGAFVTSAEWLDVNYGRLLRELLLGPLGGLEIHLLEPALLPFEGTQTTAAIVRFELGSKARSLRLRRVSTLERLAPLAGGRSVPRARLAAEARWTPLFGADRRRPAGLVELGELFEVHRGQVTGANQVWIQDGPSAGLPSSLLFPTVTRARELFLAAGALDDASSLRSVLDLPVDLDELPPDERRAVEAFLKSARQRGAHRGFIARHRRAWWSVGLHAPAPILATYMARRPPAFVRNLALARHINVVHGLYARTPLPASMLDAVAGYLARETKLTDGRTYAGGLTKFEPKEMERLLIPPPDVLATLASSKAVR